MDKGLGRDEAKALAAGLHGRRPAPPAISSALSPERTDIWRTGKIHSQAIDRVAAGQVAYAQPGQSVCKTVGLAYVGSNPTPATICENGP